jgi:two-component system NtrC family response regulator
MDALIKYSFPGNVRELENIVQRAVVLTRKDLITKSDLPIHIAGTDKSNCACDGPDDVPLGDLNQAVADLERRMIDKALTETNGNQSKAAELLGINERTLRYKLKK